MRCLSLAVIGLVVPCSVLSARELPTVWVQHERGEEHGSMAFSPEGKILFTAGGMGSPIKSRDVNTGQPIASFEDAGFIFAMQVSPDGKLLATASQENSKSLIRLRTLPAGTVIAELPGGFSPLGFTSDSKSIIFGKGKQIEKWDVLTHKMITTLPIAGRMLAVSVDGRQFAVTTDHQIEIWDLNARKRKEQFEFQKMVYASEFSPSGKKFAYSGGTTIRIQELNTASEVVVLDGYDDKVDSIAFSPDGRHLAVARLNGVIELWKIASRHKLGSAKGGPAGQVAFHPDGKRFAHICGISDYSQSVYLWRVTERSLTTP